MRRIRRTVMALLAATGLAAGVAGLNGVSAGADYGPGAVYQIMFSGNCDSPTACAGSGFGEGGFWGWIGAYGTRAGGTGNFEVTFCQHTAGGGGSAGAGHMAGDLTWVNAGPVLVFFVQGHPVFAAPSAPGHYTGFAGLPNSPGVNTEVQVSLSPTAT